MVPPGPEETFKVSDRRRRPSEDEPPAPAPPPPGRAGEVAREQAPPLGAEAERSLVGLFMMLASSAVIALGDAPDPVTGQRHHDPAHAADAIDLLILLREKTEGNRSAEESQVLDNLLHDLQLRYVNATRRSGSPPGPSRS
jgi:hypothetical protein